MIVGALVLLALVPVVCVWAIARTVRSPRADGRAECPCCDGSGSYATCGGEVYECDNCDGAGYMISAWLAPERWDRAEPESVLDTIDRAAWIPAEVWERANLVSAELARHKSRTLDEAMIEFQGLRIEQMLAEPAERVVVNGREFLPYYVKWSPE